jgi:hypothetical protein
MHLPTSVTRKDNTCMFMGLHMFQITLLENQVLEVKRFLRVKNIALVLLGLNWSSHCFDQLSKIHKL